MLGHRALVGCSHSIGLAVAIKAILPLVGAYTPVTTVEGGGLAGAVGADEGHDLALAHLQGQVVSTATTPPNCMVTFSSMEYGVWLILPHRLSLLLGR